MARIVQKYGGTSVGDVERIKKVAERIKATRDEGNELVVVVSARAGVTNELIARAKAITEHPERARDRHAPRHRRAGDHRAHRDGAARRRRRRRELHRRAGGHFHRHACTRRPRSRRSTPKPSSRTSRPGKVIIVAGFQGINDDGQITTLGRGGSDLTAIALAAAVQADKCEIYTDVDGVYTADPRVVKRQKLTEISYDEMLELASSGSKVMQSRSVEFAKKYNVVFEVRSSFNHNPGTIVKEEVAYMEKVVVRGVAVDKDQAKVIVSNIVDKPGSAAKVFRALADANIIVDMIVQNVGRTAWRTSPSPSRRETRTRRPEGARAGSPDRRRPGRHPRADRQALGRRRRHEDAQRRRRHALPGAGRCRHQHRAHHHLGDQDLHRDRHRTGWTRPPGSPTRRSPEPARRLGPGR
jgi:aspartate kinase